MQAVQGHEMAGSETTQNHRGHHRSIGTESQERHHFREESQHSLAGNTPSSPKTWSAIFHLHTTEKVHAELQQVRQLEATAALGETNDQHIIWASRKETICRPRTCSQKGTAEAKARANQTSTSSQLQTHGRALPHGSSPQTVMLTHLGDDVQEKVKSHGLSLTSVSSAAEQLV